VPRGTGTPSLSLSQAVELPGVPPENVVILLIDPQTLVVRGKLERVNHEGGPEIGKLGEEPGGCENG